MREERKAETRQKILEAAGALFRKRGIDAVGVDAIMHAAGLTHGGFYAHFASKEALVAEVSAASLARAAARWERISQEDDSRTALAKIVEAYLDPAHVAASEQGCMLTTLGPRWHGGLPRARPSRTRFAGWPMRWHAACRAGTAATHSPRCPAWSVPLCWRACRMIRNLPTSCSPPRSRRRAHARRLADRLFTLTASTTDGIDHAGARRRGATRGMVPENCPGVPGYLRLSDLTP